MIAFVYPLLFIAAAGFVAAFGVHLAALFGFTNLFEHSVKILAPGLFLVSFPTVWISARLTRDVKQRQFWRAALRGCPKWMQRALWVLCGYSWVGFFALHLVYGGSMDGSANMARSMSGMLFAFYAIAACILYSATQTWRVDEDRYCVNGHRVSPFAKYCEECGAPAQVLPRSANDGRDCA